MIILFIMIILVYLKNNFMFESNGFPYLIALGLPVIVLTVLGSIFLYKTYISKLEQSHRSVYTMLVSFLVVIGIAIAVFIVMLSLFLSKPDSMKSVIIISVVPYYVVFIITSGFFIYISPGLLDKINGIPKY